MITDELKQLQNISTMVGIPVEYTQGGGGNTSAKLDDELMAVKASGFKLKQITANQGYVVVNWQRIRDYFAKVDLGADTDFEKESVEFIKNSVVPFNGVKALRPSVEAGFHSMLQKYVIHTHSVYANMICCAMNGKDLATEIFGGCAYGFAWIPYINPGFCLTLKIKAAIRDCLEKTAKYPAVILMENHGLIVTDDDSVNCLSLHQQVNDRIRNYLGFGDAFPTIKLTITAENQIVSETPYIRDYFKGRSSLTEGFFNENVLYPDQLVYLNGKLSVNDNSQKMNINTLTGQVLYKTGIAEAQTMEETLLAYLYVIEGINQNHLTIKTMSEKEINFIKNWESEAYRRNLLQEKKC